MKKEHYQPDPDNFAEIVTPEENVKRYVVCAANRYGELILCGPRHHDTRMNQTLLLLKEKGLELGQRDEEGFVDQFGIFLSREEACKIVLLNKQPLQDPDLRKRLFSENLY